ncbi:MAG: hypothetical protein OIN87_05005 [Candidatus Methanoperedens sp.]|nr:hypothetical protein [Candidatus Methanoperedens sp.]
MELHLVHQSDAGKYAVIGIMIKSGSENEAYIMALSLPHPAQKGSTGSS